MDSSDEDTDGLWYKVCRGSELQEGHRIHVEVNKRYITIFRSKGTLSSIDAVCYHAGGPLTKGSLQDIEDLGMTVVLCPWHKFMVDIKTGVKAYQGIDIVDGKPVQSGWKIGKHVQRAHTVIESPYPPHSVSNVSDSTDNSHVTGIGDTGTTYLYVLLNEDDSEYPSDTDAMKSACMREYNLIPAATPVTAKVS